MRSQCSNCFLLLSCVLSALDVTCQMHFIVMQPFTFALIMSVTVYIHIPLLRGC